MAGITLSVAEKTELSNALMVVGALDKSSQFSPGVSSDATVEELCAALLDTSSLVDSLFKTNVVDPVEDLSWSEIQLAKLASDDSGDLAIDDALNFVDSMAGGGISQYSVSEIREFLPSARRIAGSPALNEDQKLLANAFVSLYSNSALDKYIDLSLTDIVNGAETTFRTIAEESGNTLTIKDLNTIAETGSYTPPVEDVETDVVATNEASEPAEEAVESPTEPEATATDNTATTTAGDTSNADTTTQTTDPEESPDPVIAYLNSDEFRLPASVLGAMVGAHLPQSEIDQVLLDLRNKRIEEYNLLREEMKEEARSETIEVSEELSQVLSTVRSLLSEQIDSYPYDSVPDELRQQWSDLLSVQSSIRIEGVEHLLNDAPESTPLLNIPPHIQHTLDILGGIDIAALLATPGNEDPIAAITEALNTQGDAEVSDLLNVFVGLLPETLDTYGEVADFLRGLSDISNATPDELAVYGQNAEFVQGIITMVSDATGQDIAAGISDVLNSLEASNFFSDAMRDTEFTENTDELQFMLKTAEFAGLSMGINGLHLTQVPASIVALVEQVVDPALLIGLAGLPISEVMDAKGINGADQIEGALTKLGLDKDTAAQLDVLIANSDARLNTDSTVDDLLAALKVTTGSTMAEFMVSVAVNVGTGAIREVNETLKAPISETLDIINLDEDAKLQDILMVSLGLPEFVSIPVLGEVSWDDVFDALGLGENTTLKEFIEAIGGNMEMNPVELAEQLREHLEGQTLELDLGMFGHLTLEGPGVVDEVVIEAEAAAGILPQLDTENSAQIIEEGVSGADNSEGIEEINGIIPPDNVFAGIDAGELGDAIAGMDGTASALEAPAAVPLTPEQADALATDTAELINYFRSSEVDSLPVDDGAYTDSRGILREQGDVEAGSRRIYAYNEFVKLDEAIEIFKEHSGDETTHLDDDALQLVEQLGKMGLNLDDVEGLINAPDKSLVSAELLQQIAEEKNNSITH